MRLFLVLFFLSGAGFSFAQDTTFAQGPQYLIANGSPMFLRSIATPTLSFSSANVDAYNGTELAPSQVASPTTAPSSGFRDEVYWGERKPDQFMQPRISTPILTAEQTAFYTYATANGVAAALSAPPTTALELPVGSTVIEITSAQMPANLPPSIFDSGVSGIADLQSLSERGYGISLGEFAARLRAHKRAATRVFTNEDLHK
jgi:hypothetical protein